MRQPRHPQDPRHPRPADQTSPLPRPLHPDRILLDQSDRALFGYLTDQLARRGVHKSVQALEKDVRAWIQQWNTNPQALGVEEGRRRDPRLTRQISTRNFRCRTLGVPGRDVGDGRLIGEVTV